VKRGRKKPSVKSERIRRLVHKYGKDILQSEGFKQSENYIQHGKRTVLQHSIDVANTSLSLSRKLPFKFKEKDIVRGALLHDYFQYDWHHYKVKSKGLAAIKELHGFSHPYTALQNASRDFRLSHREKDIIKKHMWPLTPKPPMCREAWIVTFADKYCSLKETLNRRKG